MLSKKKCSTFGACLMALDYVLVRILTNSIFSDYLIYTRKSRFSDAQGVEEIKKYD